MDNDKIKIGDLAKLTGVRLSTIKYYTEIGILPFEQQEGGLARRFNLKEASKRLKEIEKLKEKRLNINEIIEHFKR